MNSVKFLLCSLATLFLSANPVYADETGTDSTSLLCPIESAQEAVARAFEYTGFREIKDVSDSRADEIARLATAVDSTTPYLSDTIDGLRVWEVRLDSVFLDLPGCHPDWVQKYNPKSFIALIDSATGRLLKVYSEYKGYDPDLAPEPPAKLATEMLRETGEIFTGFPDNPPAVSFLEALNSAIGSNPLKAKEIIAVCVMHRKSNRVPKPVWSITGRGIPPLDFSIVSRDDIPLRYRNRERTVVDATTGQPMFVTNNPRLRQ